MNTINEDVTKLLKLAGQPITEKEEKKEDFTTIAKNHLMKCVKEIEAEDRTQTDKNRLSLETKRTNITVPHGSELLSFDQYHEKYGKFQMSKHPGMSLQDICIVTG